MKSNEILDEIYRVRDEIMRECDYDADKYFAMIRRHELESMAKGKKVVSFEKDRQEPETLLREEQEKYDSE